jgi:hypothetical protein
MRRVTMKRCRKTRASVKTLPHIAHVSGDREETIPVPAAMVRQGF